MPRASTTVPAGYRPTRPVRQGHSTHRHSVFQGAGHSQGILTDLVYSVQAAPKVFDKVVSSIGAKIREPMYRTAPTTAPSHVLRTKPSQGSTSSATAVY